MGRPRSCARWSSAPRRGRRSTTWSPTACRSSWRSAPTSRSRRARGRRGRGRGPSRPETPPMPIELTAHTEAGARLVALAEHLADSLAARAAEHDRNGTYPFEAVDALKAAGYFGASIPPELGGLGV